MMTRGMRQCSFMRGVSTAPSKQPSASLTSFLNLTFQSRSSRHVAPSSVMVRLAASCTQPFFFDKTRRFFSRSFSASLRPGFVAFTRHLSSAPHATAPPNVLDALVKRALMRRADVSHALSSQGWACIDNLMGADACCAMRMEADSLLRVKLTEFTAVRGDASLEVVQVGCCSRRARSV
jgi:hypothetical protein